MLQKPHEQHYTHSSQCVLQVPMSNQWNAACVWDFSNVRIDVDAMHAVAHGGCADTVRESALKGDGSGRQTPLWHRGLEPESLLRLAFRSNALPTEPHSTTTFNVYNNNNNVHCSCAHQRPERSHDTY